MMFVMLLAMILHGFSPLAPRSPAYPVARVPSLRMPGGRPFESTPGRFTMIVPSGFGDLEVNKGYDSATGVTTIIYTTNDTSGMCMLRYSDIPATTPLSDEARRSIITGTKRLTIENFGGRPGVKMTVTNDHDTTVDGLPGASLSFILNDDTTVIYGRFNYCIEGTRLYQIGYVGAMRADSWMEQYFGSLKITRSQGTRPLGDSSTFNGGRFVEQNAGFSFILPAGSSRPEVAVQKVDEDGLSADIHTYTSQGGNATFTLAYVELPPATITPEDRNGMFGATKEGRLDELNAMPGIHARIVSESDTTMGGILHHVVALSIEENGGTTWERFDLILTSGRFYQMMASTSSEKMRSDRSFEQYFSSFATAPLQEK